MKIKRTIKEIFSRLKTHRSWSFILCLLILGVVSHYVSLGATQNFQDIQDNGGIQVFSRINVKSRDGGHHLGGKKRGELVLLCKSITIFREGHVYLNFYYGDGVENEIAISKDNKEWKIISRDTKYEANKLPLTRYINGWPRFYLRLKAENNNNKNHLILKDLTFSLESRSKKYILKNFLYLLLCVPTLFYLFQLKTTSIKKSLFLSSGISFLGIYYLVMLPNYLDFTPDFFLILISLHILLIYRKIDSIPLNLYLMVLAGTVLYLFSTDFLLNQRHLVNIVVLVSILWKVLNYFQIEQKYKLLLLIILLYGTYARINQLLVDINSGAPMAPDAMAYNELLQTFQFSNFYGASYREPLPVAAMKLYYKILQTLGLFDSWQARNFLPLRSFSVIFSILVILLTYYLGKDLVSEKVGIIASLLVAGNYLLISHSTYGLATEFYLVFIFIFFNFLFSPNKLSIATKSLLVGILGGGLFLVRSSAPFLLVSSLVLAGIKRRKDRNPILLLSIFIAGLIAFPFYLNSKKHYGEYDYITRSQAISWRNYEFMDQAGYLRKEALDKNIFLGEKITPFEYYFKLHSPTEIARRLVLGVHYAFANRIYMFDKLIMPLTAIGLILILFSRFWIITLLWGIMILPYLFILTLNAPERYTYESFPLMAIAIAYMISILPYFLKFETR